ncbi:hypothetical protein Tco_1147553, partial [Tanacetum coccineum]
MNHHLSIEEHPLKNMEDRGIFDSGCSGHMTGNKDHLDDFKECKGESELDVSRSRDGDNNHGLGTCGRRQVPTQRECTYTDFLKCQPMNFKAKVERYVGGLPDMIHGSVKASKPQSMQEAIEFATEMMDKKVLTAAERQAENKRKFEDTLRNNQNQQQPFKRNNVARSYTAGPGDKKPYGGTNPL